MLIFTETDYYYYQISLFSAIIVYFTQQGNRWTKRARLHESLYYNGIDIDLTLLQLALDNLDYLNIMRRVFFLKNFKLKNLKNFKEFYSLALFKMRSAVI